MPHQDTFLDLFLPPAKGGHKNIILYSIIDTFYACGLLVRARARAIQWDPGSSVMAVNLYIK